jgi:hypothetical protein
MVSWVRVAQPTYLRATSWTSGVWFRAGERDFSSPLHADRLWGSPSLLSNGCQVLSPRTQSGQSVKLTTCRAIPPLALSYQGEVITLLSTGTNLLVPLPTVWNRVCDRIAYSLQVSFIALTCRSKKVEDQSLSSICSEGPRSPMGDTRPYRSLLHDLYITFLTSFNLQNVLSVILSYPATFFRATKHICISLRTIIYFLDIIHRPVFYLKRRFGDCILPPSSGKTTTHLGPIDRAGPYLWTPKPTQDRIYKPNTT